MQLANDRGSRTVHDDCVLAREEKRREEELEVYGNESTTDSTAGMMGSLGKHRNRVPGDEHMDGIAAAACSMQGWR